MMNENNRFFVWVSPNYVLVTLTTDEEINAHNFPSGSFTYSLREGTWYETGIYQVPSNATYCCWNPVNTDEVPSQIVAAKNLLGL